MTAARQMRADAVRTRKALLKAAAEVFAEQGMDACVAEIATRAGIGKGTVFRHFPTKDDLAMAVIEDAIDELAAKGRELAQHPDPDAAVLEYIGNGVETHLRNRAFVDALRITPPPPELEPGLAQLIATAETLAGRAHAGGSLRPDVSGHDIVLLMCGVYYAAAPLLNVEPLAWKRFLRLFFEGMQVRA
ncbi:TetR/AcrR family transcriptional regulator [Kibdelosporangium aridum]|uniref:TetR/AcrR family transcriptional regulator n=1 Tax=Kibdelosporangium aridum TaxID=2030 RepID=UPI00068D8F92